MKRWVLVNWVVFLLLAPFVCLAQDCGDRYSISMDKGEFFVVDGSFEEAVQLWVDQDNQEFHINSWVLDYGRENVLRNIFIKRPEENYVDVPLFRKTMSRFGKEEAYLKCLEVEERVFEEINRYVEDKRSNPSCDAIWAVPHSSDVLKLVRPVSVGEGVIYQFFSMRAPVSMSPFDALSFGGNAIDGNTKYCNMAARIRAFFDDPDIPYKLCVVGGGMVSFGSFLNQASLEKELEKRGLN